MRVFNAESGWDKAEQKWIQILTIDGQEVDLETYAMELDKESNDNEEGVIAYSCDDYQDDNEEEDNDEHDEDCMCEDCLEDRKNIYLAEAVKFLFENKLCPKHVFELLGDIYDKANYEGYEEGYEDAKLDMREFLED